MSSSDELVIDSLRALSATAEPAESPEFTAQVLAQVSELANPKVLRRRKLRRRLGMGTVAVILGVIPGPRTALARWLGIGSVRIERGHAAFEGIPKPILELDLGTRSSVADASRQLGRHMAVAADQQPAGVWVQKPDQLRGIVIAVNSVYVRGKAVALVRELPGGANVAVAGKIVGPDTQTEFLTIKERTAVWISGAPHQVAFLGANGNIVYEPVRLAGNVLLWADDTRTIRIEGLQDRSAAVALLQALR